MSSTLAVLPFESLFSLMVARSGSEDDGLVPSEVLTSGVS